MTQKIDWYDQEIKEFFSEDFVQEIDEKCEQKLEGEFLSILKIIQKCRGEGHSEENACHQLREPDGHNMWYYLKQVQ